MHLIEPLERRYLLAASPSLLRIDSGSTKNYVDNSGNNWSADYGSIGGATDTSAFDVANTTNDPLYLTRRYGNFDYALPVQNGIYTLSLSFVDPYFTAAGKRIFNVFAEGKSILSNFDVVANVGGKTSVTKSFPVSITDGQLNLNFRNVISNAMVSAIALLPQPATAFPTPGFSPLFNGVNLNGFYTFIDTKGVNNDPDNFFKVENGAIHVLGIPSTTARQPYGYLATTTPYSDYRLRWQYQWGTTKFSPKLTAKRDAGVMYHVTGADGIFPNSAEFQNQEGDTGDVWLIANVTGTATVVPGNSYPVEQKYQEGGTAFTSTRPYTRLIKSATADTLTGWNTCELIVAGDQATYIVNGKVVNRVYGLKLNGSAFKSGKIAFQAEGAEVFYRNIELQRLDFTPPPTGSQVLFNGSSTSAWHKRVANTPIAWTINSAGALEVTPGTGDIVTNDLYSDFTLHLEFKTNVTPGVTSEQGKGNSGIYLQGRYEIQVLDSYGVIPSGKNDLGAIYGVKDPVTNAAFPAETWQKYDITFKSARWSGSTKTANARVTVKLNGIVVQNDVEIPLSTLLGDTEANSPGPILLQDHANRVQYRNIWVMRN